MRLEHILEAMEVLAKVQNLATRPEPGEIGRLRAEAFCARSALQVALSDFDVAVEKE